MNDETNYEQTPETQEEMMEKSQRIIEEYKNYEGIVSEDLKSFGINKPSLFEQICDSLIIISWLGCVYAIIHFSQVNEMYVPVAFGTLIFLITLISQIKSKSIGIMAMIGTILGAIIAVVPILMMKPELLPFEIHWGKVIAFFALSLTFVLGVVMLNFARRMNAPLEKRCTEVVTATVVGHDVSGYTKAAIYSYEYNQKNYEYIRPVYSIFSPVEGSKKEIKINPDVPSENADMVADFRYIPLIMGIVMILISLPILIQFVIQFIL